MKKSFIGIAAAAVLALGMMTSPPAFAGGKGGGGYHYGQHDFSDMWLLAHFGGDANQVVTKTGYVTSTIDNGGEIGHDASSIAVGSLFQRDGNSECDGPCADVPAQLLLGSVNSSIYNHGEIGHDASTAGFGNWMEGTGLKLGNQIDKGDVAARIHNWGEIGHNASTIAIGNGVTTPSLP